MKSYTDLEQSKVLSKILPLESADMWYSYYGNSKYNPTIAYKGQQWFLCQIRNSLHDDIPCWSFTALFNVMPQINKWFTPYGHKDDKLFQFDPKICKMGEHSIIPSYKVTYSVKLFTDIYDNPVDACYEMILKLHELKML